LIESHKLLGGFYDAVHIASFEGVTQVLFEGDLARCVLLRECDDFDGVLL
jgi:hypothetical protein